jgi:hypothetical protein
MKKLDESKTVQPTSAREKRIIVFIQNHPGCSSGEIAKKLDLVLATVKKIPKHVSQQWTNNKRGAGQIDRIFFGVDDNNAKT